jgi:hypothetical protein
LYDSASIAARIPSSSTELAVGGSHQDGVDEASERFGLDARFARGLSQGHHLPGVQVDDLPMEQRRRLVGGLDVHMYLGAATPPTAVISPNGGHPVHLTRELLAEFLEQVLPPQLSLKPTTVHARFRVVATNRQQVVARP